MSASGRLRASAMRAAFLLPVLALALASCSDPEELGREAVLGALEDPDSARFGRYTRVGTRACLTVNARGPSGAYAGDRQAVLVKAETHGENRPWSVEGFFDEGHHACVARLSAQPKQPESEDIGSALPLVAARARRAGFPEMRRLPHRGGRRPHPARPEPLGDHGRADRRKAGLSLFPRPPRQSRHLDLGEYGLLPRLAQGLRARNEDDLRRHPQGAGPRRPPRLAQPPKRRAAAAPLSRRPPALTAPPPFAIEPPFASGRLQDRWPSG